MGAFVKTLLLVCIAGICFAGNVKHSGNATATITQHQTSIQKKKHRKRHKRRIAAGKHRRMQKQLHQARVHLKQERKVEKAQKESKKEQQRSN